MKLSKLILLAPLLAPLFVYGAEKKDEALPIIAPCVNQESFRRAAKEIYREVPYLSGDGKVEIFGSKKPASGEIEIYISPSRTFTIVISAGEYSCIIAGGESIDVAKEIKRKYNYKEQ